MIALTQPSPPPIFRQIPDMVSPLFTTYVVPETLLGAGLEALLERPQGLGVGAGAAARLSDRGATGNGAGVGAVLAAEAFEAEELADEEPPEERRRP